MDDYVLKYLWDAREAAHKICRFLVNKTFADYENDDMLRSAVERQFEILGEALNRVKKMDENLFLSIRGAKGAISFRNMLAHEYNAIDNLVVWDIIETDLPDLRNNLDELMR
jgi:uncharacterized protein with HEPN domain